LAKFSHLRHSCLNLDSAARKGDKRIRLRNLGEHEYWSELLRLKQEDFQKLSGHKQVTDFYLAELAGRHRAKVATLDSGMRAIADHFVVIANSQ
jgi:hypothetical protein